jgi:hypothetical protein
LNGAKITSHLSSIPAAWTQWIRDQVILSAKKGIAYGQPVKVDGAIVGEPGVQVTLVSTWVNGAAPIAKVTHPIKNEEWGLYLDNLGADGQGSFSVTFKKVEKNWLDRAFDWIARLVAKIIDFVGDVVQTVGSLACALISSSGAQAAGAAAGTAAGVGPVVGAAGASVAQAVCANPPPPPPEPPPGSSAAGLLPVAIAAGGVVLLAAILKKKKRSP